MIIQQFIKNDPYEFEVHIRSNTVYAHSLLSDNKEEIHELLKPIFVRLLELIEQHRELKK